MYIIVQWQDGEQLKARIVKWEDKKIMTFSSGEEASSEALNIVDEKWYYQIVKLY